MSIGLYELNGLYEVGKGNADEELVILARKAIEAKLKKDLGVEVEDKKDGGE